MTLIGHADWCAITPTHACICAGYYPDAEMAERDAALIEQACEVMHDAYEAAAVREGWATQQRSRKPWADVPEANKATMRAAIAALLEWLPTTRVSPSFTEDADVLTLMRLLAPVVEHRRHYGLNIEDAEVYARTVLDAGYTRVLPPREGKS